jgi:hypothetical protein
MTTTKDNDNVGDTMHGDTMTNGNKTTSSQNSQDDREDLSNRSKVADSADKEKPMDTSMITV